MDVELNEIQEQAMIEVLTDIPTIQETVVECVNFFAQKQEDPSVKQYMANYFTKEAGDDLNQLQATVPHEFFFDLMYDGLNLLDKEELAMMNDKA